MNYLISKNERSSFESPLLGNGRSLNVGGQTDGGRALSGGVDCARRDLFDVLQELGLRSTRISAKQNVDVATNFVLVLG